MGILHRTDRQRDIVYIVWDGVVTWEDWVAHVQTLSADPDWAAISRYIADVQTVSDTSTIGERQFREVERTFEANRQTLARKRSAVLAAKEFRRADRFGKMIARFGTASVVFNQLDTACLFLGIDPAHTRETLDRLRAQLRGQA